MKRALLGADPRETTIHIRLARLHADLDEYQESAAYHQRVIDVCTEDSEYKSSIVLLDTRFVFCLLGAAAE